MVDSGRVTANERGASLNPSAAGVDRRTRLFPVPHSLPSQPQPSSPFEFACPPPLPQLPRSHILHRKKNKPCIPYDCMVSLSPAHKKTNKICESPVSCCSFPTGHHAFVARPIVALFSHDTRLTVVSTKELVGAHAATLATTANPEEVAKCGETRGQCLFLPRAKRAASKKITTFFSSFFSAQPTWRLSACRLGSPAARMPMKHASTGTFIRFVVSVQ